MAPHVNAARRPCDTPNASRRPASRPGGATEPSDVLSSGQLLDARAVHLRGVRAQAALALAGDRPLDVAGDGGDAERHRLDVVARAGVGLDALHDLLQRAVLELGDG